MRHLQRARLAQEPRPRAIPVALTVAPEDPNRDRMSERPVHPAKHLAAETSGTETLAELVRGQQSGARRRRAERRRMCAVTRGQRARELQHVHPAILRMLRHRAADGDVDAGGELTSNRAGAWSRA